MSYDAPSPIATLSKPTPFFGIKLWLLILIMIGLLLLLILLFISLCFLYLCHRKPYKPRFHLPNPIACTAPKSNNPKYCSSSLDRRLLQCNNNNNSTVEIEIMDIAQPDLQVMLSDRWSGRASGNTSLESTAATDVESVARHSPVVSDAWRGNRFCLKEIEVVTNAFAEENLVGEGYYGIVYRGVLLDTTRVTVNRLLGSSCQGQDFVAEVEAIGYVRHKNLVKLLGYCMEGANRMLIHEYVDNGNLHQWLHGFQGQVSPLTWNIRMNIIQGIAKGLTYLHEDIEPKIVHQHLKSSNVLLDHQWNPKISDFGLAKLFGHDWSRITAHVMGSLGYLAQEYATSKCWNEKTDVYSFGVLIMEIISGRFPADHSQPQVYLIDWLRSMVANQKIMYVTDPKLPEMPSLKELKRIILIALRCVDPDVEHRPKMGDLIHMLEPRDLLLSDVRTVFFFFPFFTSIMSVM
ncbi:probable serine/threonine-protein kinase At1g01540 [Tripterygium wilfordii]|uniref:probable serine/threonine-protein kinase At1g01540 n=1 Tax=Tripterygium wilfordii TaxID=458696 RepID=UPI0018F7FBBB|nr:probable serine/threonine-protein kinase At1g01540 [Tripterygium wilfordii]